MIPISVEFTSGDEVTFSGITGLVGRMGIDNGDKEKFHAANVVSLQRDRAANLVRKATAPLRCQ